MTRTQGDCMIGGSYETLSTHTLEERKLLGLGGGDRLCATCKWYFP